MTSAFQASVLIGLLLAVAAGVGLFVPGSYKADTAFAAAAFRGTDLVSLVVALPTLAGSLFLARRGSGRALLVWLGTLAHITYTYLYSFAIVWNRLFLVYVGLLSLSGFTLVRALTALDATCSSTSSPIAHQCARSARSCGSSGPCLGWWSWARWCRPSWPATFPTSWLTGCWLGGALLSSTAGRYSRA